MFRYTHFTKLKHLIFLNVGSSRQQHIQNISNVITRCMLGDQDRINSATGDWEDESTAPSLRSGSHVALVVSSSSLQPGTSALVVLVLGDAGRDAMEHGHGHDRADARRGRAAEASRAASTGSDAVLCGSLGSSLVVARSRTSARVTPPVMVSRIRRRP
jgi:hypothetical protein